VRTRAFTEAELLEAVLDRHPLAEVEKFVQEIFWRTYWKGWLESHPGAWSRYRARLAECLSDVDADAGLRASYERAVAGRTGIAAFDAWARELTCEHYLHNHARMWFASIWIFTLKLPWELGADFFMRHLFDGDQASNTLSWRWVAGLHTRGKRYLATCDNIRRYTEGRFAPASGIVRTATALTDPAIPHAPLADLGPSLSATAGESLLLIHDDDLHGDARELPSTGVRAVFAIRSAYGRSPRAVDPAVVAFTDTLAREATGRIAMRTGASDGGLIAASDAAAAAATLIGAARTAGVTQVIAARAPVGPNRDALNAIRTNLVREGIGYAEITRRYDAVAWPAATRGFSDLRARIPAIVRELGIGAG
jgi:hypothetical protein